MSRPAPPPIQTSQFGPRSPRRLPHIPDGDPRAPGRRADQQTAPPHLSLKQGNGGKSPIYFQIPDHRDSSQAYAARLISDMNNSPGRQGGATGPSPRLRTQGGTTRKRSISAKGGGRTNAQSRRAAPGFGSSRSTSHNPKNTQSPGRKEGSGRGGKGHNPYLEGNEMCPCMVCRPRQTSPENPSMAASTESLPYLVRIPTLGDPLLHSLHPSMGGSVIDGYEEFNPADGSPRAFHLSTGAVDDSEFGETWGAVGETATSGRMAAGGVSKATSTNPKGNASPGSPPKQRFSPGSGMVWEDQAFAESLDNSGSYPLMGSPSVPSPKALPPLTKSWDSSEHAIGMRNGGSLFIEPPAVPTITGSSLSPPNGYGSPNLTAFPGPMDSPLHPDVSWTALRFISILEHRERRVFEDLEAQQRVVLWREMHRVVGVVGMVASLLSTLEGAERRERLTIASSQASERHLLSEMAPSELRSAAAFNAAESTRQENNRTSLVAGEGRERSVLILTEEESRSLIDSGRESSRQLWELRQDVRRAQEKRLEELRPEEMVAEVCEGRESVERNCLCLEEQSDREALKEKEREQYPQRCTHCTLHFPTATFEDHDTECPYKVVSCSHCGVQVQRTDLRQHIREICRGVVKECPVCRDVGDQFHLPRISGEHLPGCDMSWEACPHCENKYRKRDLGDHKLKCSKIHECPVCLRQIYHQKLEDHIAACPLKVGLPETREGKSERLKASGLSADCSPFGWEQNQHSSPLRISASRPQ